MLQARRWLTLRVSSPTNCRQRAVFQLGPEHRRRGVFSSLYQHVESLARASEDVCGIRLYVEAENVRAQRTYEVLGLDKPNYEVMEIDFSKDQDRADA